MEEMRDIYGNPIREMEEFGNPTYHTRPTKPQWTTDNWGNYGGQQQLRRSNSSSSSSSSEDDGMGGRRKKGIKQKVKEKMPGQRKGDPARAGYGTTTIDQYDQPQEKKGMMEKIKEKFSGRR